MKWRKEKGGGPDKHHRGKNVQIIYCYLVDTFMAGDLSLSLSLSLSPPSSPLTSFSSFPSSHFIT
jgi:hypothetical protein